MNEIEVVPKIDGIFLIGKSFAFCKPIHTLHIPYPLRAFNVRPSSYKGCKSLSCRGNIFGVKIGWLHNLDLEIVFPGNVRTFDFSRLLKLVEACLEGTFAEIAGTESGELHMCTRHSLTKRGRLVLIEDIDIFEKILSRKLHQKVAEIEELKDIFYVLKGTGQTCDLRQMNQFMHWFDYEYASEVVVHVAMDLTKEGNAVFFKQDGVPSKVDGVKVNLYGEYYPLLIQGTGNFYVSRNGSQECTDPSIRIVKCYNESFKYVHRVSGCPLEKELYANLLWKCMSINKPAKAADLEPYLAASRNLGVIKNNIIVVKKKTSLRGRVEFIISTLTPGRDCIRKSIELARATFKTDYYKETVIEVVPIKVVVDRLENYLEPVIETIDVELQKCVKSLQGDNVPYVLTVDVFVTVKACEAIGCFFCYGISVSTSNEKRHNNKLCRALGLTGSAQKNQPRTENLFANILSIYENGTVKAWISDAEVIADLFNNIEIDDTKVGLFLKALMKGIRPHVCQAYIKLLLRIGSEKCVTNFKEHEPCKSTSTIRRKTNHMLTSDEFIRTLARKEAFEGHRWYQYNRLLAINEAVSKIIGNDMDAWLGMLSRTLEKCMWQEMSHAGFLIGEESCLIAVPLVEFGIHVFGNSYAKFWIEFIGRFFPLCCFGNEREFSQKLFQMMDELKVLERKQLEKIKIRAFVDYVTRWSVTGMKPGRIHRKKLFPTIK